jgi:hypothetical protein
MTSDVEDLDLARRRLGLSHLDLWLRYIGLGGSRDADGVRRHLTSRDALSDIEHDHLVLALNEAFVDGGQGPVLPYRRA